MVTDRPPRQPAALTQYQHSDRLITLDLPPDDRLSGAACEIAAAMESGRTAAVKLACAEFLRVTADFYRVRSPLIRVLAARPRRVREGGLAIELFGDYTPETLMIRLWMRTAVRKQVTSFGTFLSTLCHEFCHHLDCQQLGFPHSPHTRGFYERTAALYHLARGTPPKRLFWRPMPTGQFRIDWPRTNRG
jgi:hypothetical protein